ncbi:MAG: hypothetical protein IKT65_00170 [Clostridia bacterium]|nr:hypothetical protein [Clostridia bacterium]
MQNNNIIIKRFEELSNRCEKIYSVVFSDFLDLQMQSLLLKSGIPFSRLCGGYDGAERKIAVFGEEYLYGQELELPAVWLNISPIAPKFADTLTHRDYLGALINTGIERDVLGDLIIHENTCFVFIMENMAQYVISELETVKNTKVKCTTVDALPPFAIAQPEEMTIISAGNRTDAVISSVYNISRGDAISLIQGGKVFINSAELSQNHKPLKENDIVSVRGYGRFIFSHVTDSTTRSGKLRIVIKKYN